MARSIFEELRAHLIKSDGKMNKVSLSDEEGILRVLANFIRDFMKGTFSSIYLPQAYPLRGFGGLEVIFKVQDPEQIFSMIKEIIFKIMKSTEPLYAHEDTINKCLSIAKKTLSSDAKALDFVITYFTINKGLFKEVIDILYSKGRIKGAWEAIETSLLESEEYSRAYNECRRVKVGSSKDDIAVKRVYGIARFYDNLLIITGAASHEPSSFEEIKFGRGRRMPYTLCATPFTRALSYVLSVGEGLDVYIESYKGFIRRVVKGFIGGLDPEVIVNQCSNYLEQYKQINIDTDERVVRNSVRILWKLLSEIKRRGYI